MPTHVRKLFRTLRQTTKSVCRMSLSHAAHMMSGKLREQEPPYHALEIFKLKQLRAAIIAQINQHHRILMFQSKDTDKSIERYKRADIEEIEAFVRTMSKCNDSDKSSPKTI